MRNEALLMHGLFTGGTHLQNTSSQLYSFEANCCAGAAMKLLPSCYLLPTCINFEFCSCFSTTCLRIGQKGLFWVVSAECCPSPVLFQAKGGSLLSGGNHFAAIAASSSFSGKLMSSCCDLTSHFWKMLCAWVCTVFSEMMSSSRMNGRLRPARSSAQICVSRSVKPYSF